jgi:hypothetical protein
MALSRVGLQNSLNFLRVAATWLNFFFASEHEGKAWAEAENRDDRNRSRTSHKGLNLVASKLNLA